MRKPALLTTLTLATGIALASPATAAPTGLLIVTQQQDSPTVTCTKGGEYIARNADTITHTLVGPDTISIPPGQTSKPCPLPGLYTDQQNGSIVAYITNP